MSFIAFTNAEANAFLDIVHTIICGVAAGWLAYYLLTKKK